MREVLACATDGAARDGETPDVVVNLTPAGHRNVCVIAVGGLLAVTAATSGRAQATTPPASAALHTDWDLVNAWWSGQTLSVMPNTLGRHLAQVDAQRLLNDAINKAGWRSLSGSQYNSLLNQMKCHAYFADSKPQWNLDAWRPDIGFWSTVRHQCNPTGAGD